MCAFPASRCAAEDEAFEEFEEFKGFKGFKEFEGFEEYGNRGERTRCHFGDPPRRGMASRGAIGLRTQPC